MKLIRFLVLNNIASRRKALELIKNSEIKVNGNIINDSGFEVNIGNDSVLFHGKSYKSVPELYYIALNKPTGVLTTKDDPEDRPTIYEILYNKRIFKSAAASRWPGITEKKIYKFFKQFKHMNMVYAGRLDFNSKGLIIMSNDGEIINNIISNKSKVPKVYQLKIKNQLQDKHFQSLKNGVYFEIDRKKIKFTCGINEVHPLKSNMILKITIYSGENRIIRRAFEQIHRPIISLKRTQVGPIKIRGLKKGAFRFLTEKEVGLLKRL